VPAYSLRINGRLHRLESDPTRSLLSVLRDDIGLTGAKHGCGEGQCGSCTVLLNDEAVPSCVLPLSAVGDRPVTTIEGLGTGDTLHPVQQAFLDAAAFQCGFCTPGMIVGAAALLKEQPQPSTDTIKTALEAHICRCGSYPRIVEAVRLASEALRRG
jgi:aerobic-type carbon monoxide dehydrogenase small subunit (CoxS/CutS family)